MSRIGKMPITVPNGVTIKRSGRTVTASAGKKSLSVDLPVGALMEQDGDSLSVSVEPGSDPGAWGLARSLVANAIEGVDKGFEKRLWVVGVGYSAKASGKGLTLSVGYSHSVEIPAPDGVTFEVENAPSVTHHGDEQPVVAVTVKGADKQVVGDVAARIRAVRKPEPYRGKGIRYADERVRTDKTGKAAR